MAPDADAELQSLRAEVARLRSLVGPLERSHEALRRDVADARAAVGGAEVEADRLRGQLAELHDALAGAGEIEVAVRRMSAGPLLRTVRRAGRIAHRRRVGSSGSAAPRFSVLTFVRGPETRHLSACLESVGAQTVADWEHVLVVDASAESSVVRTLDEAAADDRRVRVVRSLDGGGLAAASRAGLAAATGELVALVDHADRLEPDALAEMSAAMAEGVDVGYSDHDVIDAAGFYVDPVYKPDFSPERLRSQNYVTRLLVARRSLLDVAGGFRDGLEGAEDHDLLLRLTEGAGSVAHVPRVLYHCRRSASSGLADPVSPWATAAGARAVADHCARSGIEAAVETTPRQGCYRVVRRVAARPLVSVVIPTRGSTGRVWGVDRCFVVEAVRSLADASTYREMEVVVVHDAETPDVVLDALAATSWPISLVPFDGPFNFSAKVNLGVSAARGDLILLLNDDTQLIEPSSVEVLVGHVAMPGVAMAGAKLLFADGTMQHGGHVYAERPEHLCMGWRGDSPGPGPLWPLAVERECSGVTAACAMVRRADFEAVGGFTTELPMDYNDVDFCLKVRATGRRIIWSPWAAWYHFESQTRLRGVSSEARDWIAARWGAEIIRDPYYNPNLAPLRADYLELPPTGALRREPA